MEIMEIDVDVNRRLQLMDIALFLDVDDCPVGGSRDDFVSWVDSVINMIAEDKYDLTDVEKVIVFHHLSVGAKGLGCVCELLGIKIE